MTEKTAQQKAHEKYEQKRQGKPRYSGYLTDKQKALFTDTVMLGGYTNEKEMLLTAVAELHKKLAK